MEENQNTTINVIAPYGGFANHVGWLIWDNSSFDSVLKSNYVSKTEYNIIKGNSWPEYEEINLVNIPKFVYNEMCSFGVFDYKINNTLEFILKNVYHDKRSWHNWLYTEWAFRTRLKNIEIFHSLDKISNKELNLICCIDADLAYKNYIKINSSFNNRGLEYFFNQINEFNENATALKNQKNVLVIDNSNLLKNPLDYNYYDKIVSFLNLENDYRNANIIHNAWLTCQERAEQEFLNQIQQLYSR